MPAPVPASCSGMANPVACGQAGAGSVGEEAQDVRQPGCGLARLNRPSIAAAPAAAAAAAADSTQAPHPLERLLQAVQQAAGAQVHAPELVVLAKGDDLLARKQDSKDQEWQGPAGLVTGVTVKGDDLRAPAARPSMQDAASTGCGQQAARPGQPL